MIINIHLILKKQFTDSSLENPLSLLISCFIDRLYTVDVDVERHSLQNFHDPSVKQLTFVMDNFKIVRPIGGRAPPTQLTDRRAINSAVILMIYCHLT